jgi:single-stranded-DNA-specific exonuclease
MIVRRNSYSQEQMQMANTLSSQLNISKEISLLLINQGITDKEQADEFFNPKYDDMHSPFLMKNMRKAVFRILKAVESKQKISIFCDYDVDGTTACSILYIYFKSIDATVNYYTPNRHNDGYGLNENAVKTIIENKSDLVITVDCGITNVDECKMLMDQGIDVIVADHHECGEILPDTPYILNPKQGDCEYPYKHLSGAGIAFKLLQGLDMNEAYKMIDYAAVGTISDIVPLTGENRTIAKLGLEKMNTDISYGLSLIREFALPKKKRIDEYHIGFGFGPRINAAGRMDSANVALDVLLATKETNKAKKSANMLNELNEDRKKVCDRIMIEAEAQIFKQNLLRKTGAIFVMGNWESGVVGICASRLSNKYARPVLVFSDNGEQAVCSARSIEQIDIFQVLSNFKKYHIKFGGHSMAAGLTIKSSDFEAYSQDVNRYLSENFQQEIYEPKYVYDIKLNCSDFNLKFANNINKLAPYGQKNPKPKLLFENVAFGNKNYFGKNEKIHMKFNVKDKTNSFQAIKFFFSKKDATAKVGNLIGISNISDYSHNAEVFVDYIEQSDIDTKADNVIFIENAIFDMVHAFSNQNIMDFKQIEKTVTDYINKNSFGMCIVANNHYQLEMIKNSKAIQQLIQSSKLHFRLDGEYNLPINAIIFCDQPNIMLKSYQKMITFDSFESKYSMDKSIIVKEMMHRYKSVKNEFYADRQTMGQIFVELKKQSQSGKVFNSLNELYNLVSVNSRVDIKKIIFGLLVFKQLDLIDYNKSDNIKVQIINTTKKKDLDDSLIYHTIKNL